MSFTLYAWQWVRSFGSACSRLSLAFSSLHRKLKSNAKSFLLRRTEYPLQSIGQQQRLISFRNQLIPSIVYRVWVDDLFGRTHASELLNFRLLNPGLEFRLFTHVDADHYMQEVWHDHPVCGIYGHSHFRPLMADIFRYCILFERGGYYFDISKGCSLPLYNLHQPFDRRMLSYETSFCSVMPELATASCFQYPNRYVIQWGFGFAPKDPILERVINLICAYYPFFKGKTFEDPKSAILAFTGPGMFTKAVREIVQEEGKLEGAQAGVNFNGHGIPWMPGSEVRYHLSPPYVLARNAVIVS